MPVRCLTYGRRWRSFVIICAFASLLLAVGVAVRSDENTLLGFGTVIVLSGLILVPLLVEFYGVKITWDNQHIQTSSPWRRPRTIPTTAVSSCDFSIWAQWYRVHTEGHGTIRVHKYMTGIPEFLRDLPCPTPPYPPPLTFKEAANKPIHESGDGGGD